MTSILSLLPVLLVVASTASAFGFSADDFFDTLSDSFWTYAALAATVILVEEVTPIFGGIAANQGDLQLDRVILAITLGGWIATSILYVLGRLKWDWIRRRFPRVRATGTVALRVVGRNPFKASLFVRFPFGLRLVLPMACGAARVPLTVFLPASLVGSLLWSVLFTLIGYGAGEAAMQVMGKLGRVGEIVSAVLLTAAVVVFVRWNRRRTDLKSAKREAAALRVATREFEVSARSDAIRRD